MESPEALLGSYQLSEKTETTVIDLIAIIITVFLFVASAAASVLFFEEGDVIPGLIRIYTTPGPLVTDYYAVGGIASTFLNAAICGAVCILFMLTLDGESKPNALAGYFLVIAHCFYGLNLVNMLPCFIAPMLYFKVKKLNINDNLHVCMFATCFGPFISEFLFRYAIGNANYLKGEVQLTAFGVILAIGFALALGFIVPAILPGARAWHKGFNLFNGGLAFGIFGFFAYNFFYTTFGVEKPELLTYENAVYNFFGHSFTGFINGLFFTMFMLALLIGFFMNGRSLKGYRAFLKDSGHLSNFVEQYPLPICFINMGMYGLMFLLYVNLVMIISVGAGFTGPTTGVIFASMTFVLLGQHPRNVWPILAGFLALYVANVVIKHITGLDAGWTISSQGFINAAAFATGICPITGRYGRRAGFAAGIIDASLCRATAAFHGGLVLYNGGFIAGLTVLILLPILEHYVKEKELIRPSVSMNNFIIVEEGKKEKK